MELKTFPFCDRIFSLIGVPRSFQIPSQLCSTRVCNSVSFSLKTSVAFSCQGSSTAPEHTLIFGAYHDHLHNSRHLENRNISKAHITFLFHTHGHLLFHPRSAPQGRVWYRLRPVITDQCRFAILTFFLMRDFLLPQFQTTKAKSQYPLPIFTTLSLLCSGQPDSAALAPSLSRSITLP